MDLQVIQIDPGTGKVAFKVSARSVSGLQKLAQLVVLSLFNSPGRDVLSPDWGAGIQDMVSMNFLDQDKSEITAELARKIRKAELEIQTRQIGLNLPASERLREIRLLGLDLSDDDTEVFITIRIISELGQQTDIVV